MSCVRTIVITAAVASRVSTIVLRTGPPGATGAAGAAGAPGRTAYEEYLYWTSDDPVLSEAEWSASRASVASTDISDSTTLGRSLLTAETPSAARTELGAGATGASLFQAGTLAEAHGILDRRVYTKSSATVRNSNNANTGDPATNDSELSGISLVAGVYLLEGLFLITSTVNTGYRMGFFFGSDDGVVNYAGFIYAPNGSSGTWSRVGTGLIAVNVNNAGTAWCRATAIIRPTAATTTAALRFNQNISHPDSTILGIGSTLAITRLA